MTEFAIKTPIGYVAGINRQHMCVSCTDMPSFIKRFKTSKAANAFRRRYEGTGMGLVNATVVPAPNAVS